MPKINKICETSLRWILNYRLSKNNPYLFKIIDDNIDGHTYATYSWVKLQDKKIDKIGFHNWLNTVDAYGYGYYTDRLMINEKKQSKLDDKFVNTYLKKNKKLK